MNYKIYHTLLTFSNFVNILQNKRICVSISHCFKYLTYNIYKELLPNIGNAIPKTYINSLLFFMFVGSDFKIILQNLQVHSQAEARKPGLQHHKVLYDFVIMKHHFSLPDKWLYVAGCSRYKLYFTDL